MGLQVWMAMIPTDMGFEWLRFDIDTASKQKRQAESNFI